MALAVQELRIKGEPHAAAAAGTLHAWKVQKGQIVSAGAVLASVRSATSGHYQILASCAGVIRAILVPVGKKLAAGEVVCYIEPQGAPERPESRVPSDATPKPRQPKSVSQSAPELPRGTDKRLSTLPTVGGATGTTVPTAAGKTGTTVPSKPKRERVKLRGLYLLPSQERAIKRVVAELTLDESAPLSLNDSELVRCALDAFLSMPPAAIRATVEAYKRKEKAAGTGAGWPRPGRGGKK